MDIKRKIADNLQLILSVAAVSGVVIGVINFFILTTVAPIEKRVVALENFERESMSTFTKIIIVETKVNTMYDDIKDIKKNLNVR